VNPQIVGNGVKQGSPDDEDVDKWRYRVNLATIDFVGIDPNIVPHPKDTQITRPEYTQEMAAFSSDGTEALTYKTNAEQLAGYNQALDSAAQGIKEVAARTPWVRDYSQDVKRYKIAIGSVNAVQLNGETQAIKRDLAGTQFAEASGWGTNRDPDRNLEMRPVDITMTRR